MQVFKVAVWPVEYNQQAHLSFRNALTAYLGFVFMSDIT
jgi:hypothetical protein